MGILIKHSLEPARVRVFQHTLPVGLAGKLSANRFDDLGMIEKREECSSRSRGGVAQW